MYAIALSVAACLRAKTRVDVVWAIDVQGLGTIDMSEALALTPGGGRIGSLLAGAIDSQLSNLASRQSSTGRLVDLQVNAMDATVAGLPTGGNVRCVLAPASELPEELWERLLAREPVCLVSRLNSDVIMDTALYTSDTITDAGAEIAGMFYRGASNAAVEGDTVVTVLWPVTRLVIAGVGPIADALHDAASLLGWQTVVANDTSTATGLIAGLSPIDSLVVMSHELETAGSALVAALASDVGYIGALGSHKMQQTRADWLAYRGITDLERIHGPAGLDIGAKTPAEVAVAILAEALATRKG